VSAPLIYLAGPITKPDPMSNTHNALFVAEGLNLPIFRSIESITDWADSWIAVNA
jgi:hypothetical protein